MTHPYLIKKLILPIVLFFSALSVFAKAGTDLTHPMVAQDALAILREEGLDAYVRHWRARPDQALDFRKWCHGQKAENGGAVSFDFEIHSSAAQVVDAVNAVNSEMGFDCYRIQAKFNDTAFSSINVPTLKDAASYERVRKTRSVLIPILGYLITAKPLAMSLAQGFQIHGLAGTDQAVKGLLTEHGGEFMQANMKGFLELQFAYLSAMWSIPFSARELPHIRQMSKNYFKRAAQTLVYPFSVLSKIVNWGFKKTGYRIKASHLWISAVNIVAYPFLMGLALQSGENWWMGENASVFTAGWEMVKDQIWMSLAFNSTFMIFQDRTGEARNMGLWSEKARFVGESIPAFLFNAFRGIAAIYPAMLPWMIGAQLGIGGVLSAVMMMKVAGARTFARETGEILNKMEADLSSESRETVQAIASTLDQPVAEDGTVAIAGGCQSSLGFWGRLGSKVSEKWQRNSSKVFEKLRTGFRSNGTLTPLANQ
jgi:hypothetical protein